ncbi:MAG TPA: alcohol dehydrogenase catalytic domain-containing protein, partial [Acetobacteraceae bacterium]|nr:alcohol dehydrogenase catalytic domain-containing protein [Acetobacteraceae bacterium]
MLVTLQSIRRQWPTALRLLVEPIRELRPLGLGYLPVPGAMMNFIHCSMQHQRPNPPSGHALSAVRPAPAFHRSATTNQRGIPLMATNAYGAHAADTPLEPIMIERRAPGPHDVQIEIAYCGVCHSDLHTVRSEWGGTVYPCVPGHEIV